MAAREETPRTSRRNRRHRLWLLVAFLLGMPAAQAIPRWWSDGPAAPTAAVPPAATTTVTTATPVRHDGFAAGVRPARANLRLVPQAGGWRGEAEVWLHNPGTVPVEFTAVTGGTGADLRLRLVPDRVRVAAGQAVRAVLVAEGQSNGGRPPLGAREATFWVEARPQAIASNNAGRLAARLPVTVYWQPPAGGAGGRPQA